MTNNLFSKIVPFMR